MVDAKLVSLYKLLQLCDFFNTVWGFKHREREREREREGEKNMMELIEQKRMA